jgi:hypothetical protein
MTQVAELWTSAEVCSFFKISTLSDLKKEDRRAWEQIDGCLNYGAGRGRRYDADKIRGLPYLWCAEQALGVRGPTFLIGRG